MSAGSGVTPRLQQRQNHVCPVPESSNFIVLCAEGLSRLTQCAALLLLWLPVRTEIRTRAKRRTLWKNRIRLLRMMLSCALSTVSATIDISGQRLLDRLL
jgi:hypothetical protein